MLYKWNAVNLWAYCRDVIVAVITKNYTAGRLAGEQATAASASEVGSSGFLRLIKCEISVGLDDDVIAADVDEQPIVAAASFADDADDDEEVAAAAAVDDDEDNDFEEPASTSPLLIGLM